MLKEGEEGKNGREEKEEGCEVNTSSQGRYVNVRTNSQEGRENRGAEERAKETKENADLRKAAGGGGRNNG